MAFMPETRITAFASLPVKALAAEVVSPPAHRGAHVFEHQALALQGRALGAVRGIQHPHLVRPPLHHRQVVQVRRRLEHHLVAEEGRPEGAAELARRR
jgi:hypothetical protein